MPQRCKVCDDSRVALIDRDLAVFGHARKDVAARYDLPYGSIVRHIKSQHMKGIHDVRMGVAIAQSPEVSEALETVVEAVREDATGIEEALREISGDLKSIRERAKAQKQPDLDQELRVVDRMIKLVESKAKIVIGMLQRTEKPAPLDENPEWIGLREKIVEALQPYPEAALAVAEAIDD